MQSKNTFYHIAALAIVGLLSSWLFFPQSAQIHGRDYFLFLDGAYRVVHGLTPHIDFPSLLGYLDFWGPGLFLHYFPDITVRDPIVSYIVISGISTIIICFVLIDAESRRSFGYLLLIVAISSVSLSLLRVGDIMWPTIHGFYRRFGVGIIILITFFSATHRPDDMAKHRQFVAGALLALLGYALLFTKVTHFLAAFFILCGGVAAKTISVREIKIATVVFVLMLALTELLTHGIILAYIKDLLYVSSISDRSGGWLIHLHKVVASNPVQLFALISSILIAQKFNKLDRKAYYCSLLATTLSYAFVTKYDGGPVNLEGTFGLVPLVVLFYYRRKAFTGEHIALSSINQESRIKNQESRIKNQESRIKNLAKTKEIFLALILVISALPIFARSVVNLNVSLQYYLAELPGASFKAELGGKSVLTDSVIAGYLQKTKDLDDELIKIHEEKGALFVMDLASVFNYDSDLNPPSHAHLWIHPGLNVNKKTYSDINQIIGDADYLLLPKESLWPLAAEFLAEEYADQINSGFRIIFENKNWILRKKLAATDGNG